MPLFGRRRRKLVFHASVTVHELRNVPLSGSIVIEAGLKQWRARMHRSWPAPIGADNVARWASTSFVENRVTLHVDATTNIVDSLVMKLRVKQVMCTTLPAPRRNKLPMLTLTTHRLCLIAQKTSTLARRN